MKHIVKRAGHSETYDSKKLYASVYAACLSVRETPSVAELVAQKVVSEFNVWIKNKDEITSNDVRRMASRLLHQYNPDAGYIYLHHRIVH